MDRTPDYWIASDIGYRSDYDEREADEGHRQGAQRATARACLRGVAGSSTSWSPRAEGEGLTPTSRARPTRGTWRDLHRHARQRPLLLHRRRRLPLLVVLTEQGASFKPIRVSRGYVGHTTSGSERSSREGRFLMPSYSTQITRGGGVFRARADHRGLADDLRRLADPRRQPRGRTSAAREALDPKTLRIAASADLLRAELREQEMKRRARRRSARHVSASLSTRPTVKTWLTTDLGVSDTTATVASTGRLRLERRGAHPHRGDQVHVEVRDAVPG